MTEDEWRVFDGDPKELLSYIEDSPSERKLRLCAVACCRSVMPFLVDESTRRSVELAEAYVDARAGVDALRAAHLSADSQTNQAAASAPVVVDADGRQFYANKEDVLAFSSLGIGAGVTVESFYKHCAVDVSDAVAGFVANLAIPAKEWGSADGDNSHQGVFERQTAKHLHFIRDIFVNPFRPVGFDPTWKTRTVVAIAETIYAEQTFEDMPILADALEEAGCTCNDILNHCRQPGEHVRNCWVVDLILGKE